MINKPFAEISAFDISLLVEEKVQEGRTLEYKETLPGNSDSDKKEFLADISAFANASGGDLIYGISEQRDNNGKPTGLPQSVVGIVDVNLDSEIRRLDNLIRDAIEPRIAAQIRAIENASLETVIIIRVPNSFSAPHMVTYKNTSRFFSRNSAGKYQLDLQEIRTAFLASEALPDQISRFRHERLTKIIAGETPYPLSEGSPVVLHVIPVSSFTDKKQIDVSRQVSNFHQWISPIDTNYSLSRYNFDGFVSGSRENGQFVSGYLQIFRNGILEATDTYILRQWQDEKTLPITYLEKSLILALRNYFRLLQELEFAPPILVLLSLLNIKGFQIPLRSTWGRNITPIDRHSLILPDNLIEEFSENTDVILHPLFDVLWQSAGFEGSLNYNENGRWQERTR